MEIIASTTTLTSKETKTCSTTKSAKKIKLIPSPNNKNNYKNKNYISLKKNDLNNRNNRLYFNSNNSIKNDELQKCSSYLKNLKSNLQVEINDAKKNKKKTSARCSFRRSSQSQKNTHSSEKSDIDLIHQYKLKNFLLKEKNKRDKGIRIKNLPVNLQSYNNLKKKVNNSNLYRNTKLNNHVSSTDWNTNSLNDSREIKNNNKFDIKSKTRKFENINKNKKYCSNNLNKNYSQYKNNKSNNDIKELFEKQFEKKVNQIIKIKNNKNISNNCSIITNQIESMKSSQSKFNISTIKNEQENKNSSMNNLENYYIFLKKKIQKLKDDINIIKNEKENLLKIKNQKNESEYMKNLKDDINRYKVIIEKASKVCDEYTQEILKIRRILKEDINES